MRLRLLGMLVLLMSAPLAAQTPPVAAPSGEQIREAEDALAGLDADRLGRDQAYAGIIADHVRVLRDQPGLDAEVRYDLEGLLVVSLAAAARHDAAETAADALITARPQSPQSYAAATVAAASSARPARFAAVIERAARGITDPADRATFIALMEPELVWPQIHSLRDAGDRDSQVRLADALLRLGWPGEGEPPTRADGFRMILIERELARGDRSAAARLAGEVGGVDSVLRLVVDRTFDPLIGESDRVARVRRAIEAEDRATAARLAAAPEDTDALVYRATFLRSVGRDRDVLDLLLPLMADPALVVARGQRGLWLVNEAAYALITTDSAAEAIELMRPLASMDLRRRPDLVNTSINFTHMLYKTGRAEEALREAARLAGEITGFASDYGKMVLRGNAACAAAELGRHAESDRWLREMEQTADSNPASMIQARLCRGEMDAAEPLLIAALESERWRDQAILWFQDWDPGLETPASQRLGERFAQLRYRPAVQEAFALVGHRLRLPLPSTYYGF